jgi:hypothetical protein
MVLLHYAPIVDTLAGEPEGIWSMLGTDRLAPPIAEHEADMVLLIGRPAPPLSARASCSARPGHRGEAALFAMPPGSVSAAEGGGRSSSRRA